MALSIDLRKRIIEANENEEGSIRELAKRFKVGFASIWRLLKRYR
jgi:transposase